MRDENTDKSGDASLNRRSVLSNAVIGAGAFLGISGSATAADSQTDLRTHRRMLARFDDAAVTEAFESHTDELAAVLAERGLVSDKSELVESLDSASAKIGVVESDGRPITHVQSELQTSDGFVTVVVHAETGRAYAFHRSANEDRVLRIDPAVSDQVGTESCWTKDSECRYASCDGYENALVAGSVYEKTCCGGVCSWENTGDCCDPA